MQKLFFFDDMLQRKLVKVGVWDWPLNIYSYNSCQKKFPKEICKTLQSYTVACVSNTTSRWTSRPKIFIGAMGIYNLLYLRNGELFQT